MAEGAKDYDARAGVRFPHDPAPFKQLVMVDSAAGQKFYDAYFDYAALRKNLTGEECAIVAPPVLLSETASNAMSPEAFKRYEYQYRLPRSAMLEANAPRVLIPRPSGADWKDIEKITAVLLRERENVKAMLPPEKFQLVDGYLENFGNVMPQAGMNLLQLEEPSSLLNKYHAFSDLYVDNDIRHVMKTLVPDFSFNRADRSMIGWLEDYQARPGQEIVVVTNDREVQDLSKGKAVVMRREEFGAWLREKVEALRPMIPENRKRAYEAEMKIVTEKANALAACRG